jgi:hypothetical protein
MGKRGKKRKSKTKKQRKKQGDGTAFNSQITFVARSTEVDGVKYKDYKFKVFRTGYLELPGAHPSAIDDIQKCIGRIVELMNFYLHPGEADAGQLIAIRNINPVMKNYKFIVKMPENAILDLAKLRDYITSEIEVFVGGPRIFSIKYTRQETKLSVKFSTPSKTDPYKRMRVNIYLRGKVNILGAYTAKDTKRVCRFLHYIFATYQRELFVGEDSQIIEFDTAPLQQNVFIGPEDARQISQYWKSARIDDAARPGLDMFLAKAATEHMRGVDAGLAAAIALLTGRAVAC